MTTHSFTKFVRTMEGQYQVSLGHALAKESDEDNVSRMLPTKDPIIILNRSEVGEYNPNIENKTLSLICSYVECSPTALNCTTTVRPLGHCCDICGGILTFGSDRYNVRSIADMVDGVVKEIGIADLVKYSIERINPEGDDQLIPRFQIVVFQEGHYDDTLSRIFIEKVNRKLMSQRTNGMEYLNVVYDWSLLDHSYAPASKIAGLITFCILILIAAAVFWRNVEERERLRAFFFANTSSPFRVVWRPGKNDDDVVHLVNPNVVELLSEEEYPSEVPTFSFGQNASLLQAAAVTTTNTTSLIDSTDAYPSAMEMKLIE
ncbi:hypothetical protein Q1695_004245 [Nippostrongylus brasiliensis]|nr:hypothetical protein Q1695_004245 [Nippostrongylus brasiliensis]